MGTPSKEEHKYDADVLPTELKSDESVKENILKENELLSNEIDECSSVKSSVGTEGGDFLHGEKEINTSEELKSTYISDKVETVEVSQNERVDVSDDKQHPDPVTENLSSTVLHENNLNTLGDSNSAMLLPPEDLSTNVSEDADLNLRDESQTENSAVSVCEMSEDIVNEDKITAIEEFQEKNEVSNCESKQEYDCKSGMSAILEDNNPDNNVYCDNSSEITSVSGDTQKHSYDPDNNTVLEDSHESAKTHQEVTESEDYLDNKISKNNEIKDTIESIKISADNNENAKVELGFEEIPGDAPVSEEIHENNPTHDNNSSVEDDKIAPCEEMQNLDHNSDDNIVGKIISEKIPNHDSVNNSATNEIISTCKKLLKDDQNSDDSVIQNTLNDSKTGEDSSEIEKIPGKKRGRKPKRKSCPKIKISVSKKEDNLGSTSSSKNWYVSERKESTESTQSEDQLMKENLSSSKTGREMAENILNKDERVCFETVAEIHAVDTDTNPSCSEASLEMNVISNKVVSDNALSNLVENNTSTVSTEINKTCSVDLSAVDSSSDTPAKEVSSRTAKSLNKRKLSCLKPSTDFVVKVKEEPMDVSAVSDLEHANVTVDVKLETEEVSKSMDEITVDTPCLPSRKGRPSSTSNKKLRFHKTSTESSMENQVQKKDIKKTNSKDIVDSPSEPPSKSPEVGVVFSVGTPASKSRKKNYSPKAVIIPFSLGWMRELVHRSTERKAGQRMSDVYYFSPEGTKLRSMIEISNYLSRHPECVLTIENFTYCKELIYREPFEIERSAKQKSSFGTPSGKIETSNQASIKNYLQSSTTPKKTSISAETKSTPASSNTKKKAKVSISNSDGNVDANKRERSSKLPVKSSVGPNAKKKGGKSANDPSSIMDTVENSDTAGSKSSRRLVKKVPSDNSFDDKSEPRPKRGRPSRSFDTSAPEPEFTKVVNTSQSDNSKSTLSGNLSILSKNYSKSTAPKRRPQLKLLLSKNNNSGEIQPPCSPRCLIAAVQRPSVQCAICLCFFHPKCIPNLRENVKFACKSCMAQKLALYEKEKTSIAVSEPSLSPDDSVSFDPNVDISLLSPEVLLSVQTEPITFPLAYKSNALPKNFSNIPQGLSGTVSSVSVNNVHQENRSVSSPHLLSHLLQPTVRLNSGLLPLAPKPANQNSNSSTSRVLLTKEAAAKIFQFGMHITPGANISTSTPLLIKRLPDGRRIAVCGTTNPPTLNDSNRLTLQNPIANVNSNLQILSNISGHINGSLLSGRVNQTEVIASTNIVSNTLNKNVNFLAANSSKTSNLVTNVRTANEITSLIGFKLPSALNNASESSLSWDMNKLMSTSKSLLLVFKRLSIPDLLRASQVSSYWRYVASQHHLWEKVSLQGLTITNWERCCLALQKNGTKALDLRGIVHQNVTNPWRDLEIYVVHLAGIEELVFDQITPSLLKNVAYNMPLLRKLECHFVTTACSEPEIWSVPSEWELSSLRYLGRLVKLKIGSGSRIELKQGEDFVMPYLPLLRHVALTGFNFCSNVNLESLSKQKELISLELGDCKEIEPGIYALIENLTNLKSLRLENGGSIDECRLSEALLKIKGLEVLELMNYKISEKLSEALKELRHLIHLNVWPDNTDKAAVVNRNLFNAISSCKDLKYLCWGVIAESESIPQFLEMENSNELTFENLFNDLVALFPDGRVEVKCAPQSSWREFCSTRK